MTIEFSVSVFVFVMPTKNARNIIATNAKKNPNTRQFV